MGDALELTTRQILEPGGIDRHELSRVLDTVLGHAVDDADLYFQAVRSEAWVLEDGIVKEGSHNIEQGVGVRAVSGEKSGFAYADEVALPALQRAAGAARAIAKAGASGAPQAVSRPRLARAGRGAILRAIGNIRSDAIRGGADSAARSKGLSS